MTYTPLHVDLDTAWDRLMRHPVLGLVDGRVSYGWSNYHWHYGGQDWLACYDCRRRHVLVSPRLDKWFVPQYVIRDVLGHEILHALIPWTCKADQHSERFRQAEAKLPGHGRAERWWTRNQWRVVRP